MISICYYQYWCVHGASLNQNLLYVCQLYALHIHTGLHDIHHLSWSLPFPVSK